MIGYTEQYHQYANLHQYAKSKQHIIHLYS